MPIKVDVIDTSSTVRVRPKSNEIVRTENGEVIFDRALAAKLAEETKERKAADLELQAQLDTKPSQFDLTFTKDTGELKLEAFDKFGNPVDTTSTTIEVPEAADFIVVEEPHGIFSEDLLNYLIANKLNKLVYLHYIYSLAYTDERYWIYTVGSAIDPGIIYTIVVDTTTGEYVYSEIEEKYVILEQESGMEDDEFILTFTK